MTTPGITPRATRPVRAGRVSAASLALALGAAVAANSAIASAAQPAGSCTATQGQAYIDAGRYQRAIQEFTCVIAAQPTEADGYRGRAEARLLLGEYSDAMADYGRITAYVLPVHPDVEAAILGAYGARLAAAPTDIPALTGASFARWWAFDYAQSIQILNGLLELQPNNAYARLFRGSSRLLNGGPKASGAADMEAAIAAAPNSPDVRWVVADAYTYGWVDLQRAMDEASLALAGGLDTPRVHAILGAAYGAFGDVGAAADHIDRHIDLVTTDLQAAPALADGQSIALAIVPGRTYAIPLTVTAGESVSVAVSSKDYWDSIAVLHAPDGSPILGSDDDSGYHAAFDWVAPASGTYSVEVTFFEGIINGQLVVARD